MDTIKIVYIAANPKDTNDVDTEREYKEINEIFKKNNNKRFSLNNPVFGATQKDIADTLTSIKNEKIVIHFSGHGSQIGDFLLENKNETSLQAGAKELSQYLGSFKNIIGVVYSNCYSEDLVQNTINQINGFCIGYEETVNKDSAKNFAYQFYLSLLNNEQPKEAFEKAKKFSKIGKNANHTLIYKQSEKFAGFDNARTQKNEQKITETDNKTSLKQQTEKISKSPYTVVAILILEIVLGLWGELMPGEFRQQINELTNGHYTLAWILTGIILLFMLILMVLQEKKHKNKPENLQNATLSDSIREKFIEKLEKTYKNRLKQKLDNRLEINLEFINP